MQDSAPDAHVDVAVIGGGLAGSAAACLLLKQNPNLRVLIIEKSPVFTRRVGEATVEVSAFFLMRVLGLTEHLNQSHLVKQGMRFWFKNSETERLEQCSELGGRYLSRVPAFQVDRAILDEEVMRAAVRMGAQTWRPVVVSEVTLKSGAPQVIQVKHADGRVGRVDSRWIVDASGVAALLARRQGWLRVNHSHPTMAVWARWRGVKSLDGPELTSRYPEWASACLGMRWTATNHFVGDGWWAWCIPLKGGDVSIGVVFDQRLVNWPSDGTPGEKLAAILREHPAARELLADAVVIEGDVHVRRGLAYVSSLFCGDGFVLVGDAAAFIDPLYSPGMDSVAFTTTAAADLITRQYRGEALSNAIDSHNRCFSTSYQRWFEAVYKDKYSYLGDLELMRAAFQLDLGFYYLGVASQPFKYGNASLASPPFSKPVSLPFFLLMRLYNRRLTKMAVSRRQRGVWGRKNHGRRTLIPGFNFSPLVLGAGLARGLASWLRLEITEGWRTWFTSSNTDAEVTAWNNGSTPNGSPA